MQPGLLGGPSFPFLPRGRFRILVLRTLEKKPMYGYEVLKAIEERFQGFYKPSAGAIYPALRSLQREGLVEARGEDHRKTYRLTAKGRASLRQHKAKLERRHKDFAATVGPERAAVFMELRKTMQLLGSNLRTLNPHQAKEVRALIVEMRERIAKVLAE